MQGKIPLVMDSSDSIVGLDIDENGTRVNPFETSSDILLVHKSPIMPEGDTIHTLQSTELSFLQIHQLVLNIKLLILVVMIPFTIL